MFDSLPQSHHLPTAHLAAGSLGSWTMERNRAAHVFCLESAPSDCRVGCVGPPNLKLFSCASEQQFSGTVSLFFLFFFPVGRWSSPWQPCVAEAVVQGWPQHAATLGVSTRASATIERQTWQVPQVRSFVSEASRLRCQPFSRHCFLSSLTCCLFL